MNYLVKPTLEVIPDQVIWGGQRSIVFDAMAEDFMKSVLDVLDYVLSAGSVEWWHTRDSILVQVLSASLITDC